MTLEQSGLAALHAAGSGNLYELRDALLARSAAIAGINAAAPSDEVHSRLTTALDIGQAIRDQIRSLKVRIAADGARLSQFRNYLR
jgi:hypothetical protein